MLPTKCIAVLKRHKDEVWNIKFSQSGNKLASVGKDNMILLWSIQKYYE
jgi:WD40 repeat protein